MIRSLNSANRSLLVHDINVPCIALDYGELSMYTAHLPNHDLFFEAFCRVVNTGIEGGQLLRPRPGMIEPESDG